MSRFRICVAAATLASLTLLTVAPALAHEQRTSGAYQLTVGWEIEPAYTGVTNKVELFVKDAKGNAVDNLGPNGVKVAVTTSGKTSDPMAMTGSFDPDTGFGMHGLFLAAIVPTRPGDYTFHFTGDINGQKIDESFTSSPKTFNTVTDPAPVQFPDKVPSNAALADSTNRLGPRVDAAQASATAGQNKAKSADDSASTATTLGIVALVTGLLLGGAGLAVALTSRRKTAGAAT